VCSNERLIQYVSDYKRRNPVPDYYNLTLELSRERTTRAWGVHCAANDRTNALCPSDVAVARRYIHRSLNAACPLFVCLYLFHPVILLIIILIIIHSLFLYFIDSIATFTTTITSTNCYQLSYTCIGKMESQGGGSVVATCILSALSIDTWLFMHSAIPTRQLYYSVGGQEYSAHTMHVTPFFSHF